MEDAGGLRIVLHDVQTVLVSFPVVDDNRLVQLDCQFDLLPEQDLLLLLLTGVPVVVQPHLADGHALGMPRHLADLGISFQIVFVHILRVDAHRGIDKGIFLRQVQSHAAAPRVAARVQDQPHPGGVGGLQSFKAVGVEGAGIVMGVGIKNHLPHLSRVS